MPLAHDVNSIWRLRANASQARAPEVDSTQRRSLSMPRWRITRTTALKPRTLACMHGSAWRGDGGRLLRHLAEALAAR